MSGFNHKFDFERTIEGAIVADYECRAWIDASQYGWDPQNIQVLGIKKGDLVWVDATPELEREIAKYLLSDGSELIYERLDDMGVKLPSYANEHRLTAHELGVGS